MDRRKQKERKMDRRKLGEGSAGEGGGIEEEIRKGRTKETSERRRGEEEKGKRRERGVSQKEGWGGFRLFEVIRYNTSHGEIVLQDKKRCKTG